MGLKHCIMKVAVGAMRVAYAPIKLRRPQNQITIISRQSNTPTMDVALLSDFIKENYPETRCCVMCRHLESSNKLGYAFHMLSQMKNIASSGVVVLDGYCVAASVLNHRPEIKFVQIWHALAAIKKFGYQTIDKPSGRSSDTAEVMCMHRNYDYIVAPSMETGASFCEAFNYGTDKLKFAGLPRIDVLKDASETHMSQETRKFREQVREEYGVSDDQEIILYVPTFRKNGRVDVQSLIDAIDDTRFKLIVKLHPLYDEGNYSDQKYSTYEWLKVCDRVITDYSALGVEASLTDKPLYYYVYDIDEYCENVGLNVNPLQEMPQASARNTAQLVELLEKDYDFDKLKSFRDKYISIDTDNCTKQLGELIYGILKETL